MKKDYCTQNDGDCLTCSLVNYGRDCFNFPIASGRVRGQAFSGEGVKVHDYILSPDGAVLIWDEVAGHFTRCHVLDGSGGIGKKT